MEAVDTARWLDFVWRAVRFAFALLFGLLIACSGGSDSDVGPEGRTDCEQGCFEVELRPCRDNCPAECAEFPEGQERDRCLDTCEGDCIGEYDACVADTCASDG